MMSQGIYRRTSTMSGSPTAPKTFLGAQKQGYGNVPNIRTFFHFPFVKYFHSPPPLVGITSFSSSSVQLCFVLFYELYSTLLYSSSLIPADQTILFLNTFFLIRLTSVVFSCPLVDMSPGTSSAFSFKVTIPRYLNSLYSPCSSSMLFIKIFTQLRICYIAPTTHISSSFFFYSLF